MDRLVALDRPTFSLLRKIRQEPRIDRKTKRSQSESYLA